MRKTSDFGFLVEIAGPLQKLNKKIINNLVKGLTFFWTIMLMNQILSIRKHILPLLYILLLILKLYYFVIQLSKFIFIIRF